MKRSYVSQVEAERDWLAKMAGVAILCYSGAEATDGNVKSVEHHVAEFAAMPPFINDDHICSDRMRAAAHEATREDA